MEKQEYNKPKLIEHGTLKKITQGSGPYTSEVLNGS